MGFQAYDVALEIARLMRPLLAAIKKRDADLFDQAFRATKSMALNVAEGGRRVGKDRAYHFNVSAGSAQELRMALELAEAFEFVTREAAGAVFALIERELAMLWVLARPKAGSRFA